MTYVVLQDAAWTYYLVDFIVVMAIITGLRLFSGSVANVSLKEVLTEHDNGAMGISMAGMLVGVSIMLMGAVAGDAGATLGAEALLMVIYGVVGILLMWVTRQLFDKLSMPGLSMHAEIMKDNRAAGLVDAGNMIATALIVRAVMSWVDGSSWLGLGIVLVGYLVSQLVLVAATLYRRSVFRRRHPNSSLDEAIKAGNVALALRFSCYRIGAGLAVTAASGIVIYQPETIVMTLLVWTGVAFAFFAAITLIAAAARHILLPGVNVAEEVTDQHNIAIGALEGAVYLAIGLVMVGLFG